MAKQQTLRSMPLYHDANIVVLPTGARPTVLEVKSVLNKPDLFEALENLASLKSMEPNPQDAAAIVYAFRGFKKPNTLSAHLHTCIRARKRKNNFNPEHLPDMICVQEQQMVVVRERTPAFSMTAYRSTAPVVQSLLTQVLNALRVPNLYSLLPTPRYAPVPLFQIA
jgi:hypothetical protein